MNCCGHGKDEHVKKGKRHIWMMALCCGIPILILLLLPLISGTFPGASLILGAVVPFLCPVMMFVMMFFMFRDDKGHKTHNSCNTETIKQ